MSPQLRAAFKKKSKGKKNEKVAAAPAMPGIPADVHHTIFTRREAFLTSRPPNQHLHVLGLSEAF